MIVGEAPGANEDIEGRPFVGRSGQLLQSLLASYGFSDEDYHICNICKCRPPQNRRPEPSEISACKRLLAMQFRLVRPKVILLCGSTAYEGFFGQKVKMGDVRGRFIENNGYYIMTTYHPAYALRDPKQKIPIYEDMGKVRAKLEELGIFKPLEPLNPNA
jgi:DNA polymerase